MSNIVIVRDNVVDSNGVTLSGGSWETELPLSNILDRNLYKVARSTNLLLASTQFDFDLSRAYYVDSLVLVNHNFGQSAKVRVRSSYADPTFVVTSYDSGWIDVFQALFQTESLEWEDDNWWTGKLSSDDLDGYTLNYILLPASSTAGRYWRVEIDDTTNSAGYVQMSRIFLGKKWQPGVNFIYGGSVGFVPRSKVDQSLGGQLHFEVFSSPRVFAFEFDALTVTEAWDEAFELIRRKRDFGEIFVIPDPSDSLNTFRNSYLGRMRVLDTLEYLTHENFGMSFEVEELL